MANDPTVKAGSWGARTVEKIVRLTEHALRHELPVVLARRLRRRPHHRPGRAVPRPPGRGPHLRQPGAAVGQGAAGVLPVRPVGRGRRVHPELLRHRDHGRGQRVDVPRLAAHGRDGDRRDRHARGDGRRAHARDGVGLRRQPRRRRRRRDRAGQAAGSRTCRRTWRDAAARVAAAAEPVAAAHRRRRAGRRRRRATTCTASIDGLVDAGSFFEVKPLCAPRADRRLRPARRPSRSASSPTTRCRRAACCSSTRPTRRRASSGCATRSTCRCVFLADVPGFMIGTAGRAPGHHPPRRQDDHRGRRGDGAEGLA